MKKKILMLILSILTLTGGMGNAIYADGVHKTNNVPQVSLSVGFKENLSDFIITEKDSTEIFNILKDNGYIDKNYQYFSYSSRIIKVGLLG